MLGNVRHYYSGWIIMSNISMRRKSHSMHSAAGNVVGEYALISHSMHSAAGNVVGEYALISHSMHSAAGNVVGEGVCLNF